MILKLDAIKFNHDPSSASVDAFNIRKNESVFVEAPEWRRGLNINPEDSPAAYSLFDTRGNTLTIQASFSCEDQRVDCVDIRALDGRLYPQDVGDFFGSTLVTDLLRPFLFNSVGNVLGEVEARNLKLSNGTTGFKTFNLKNAQIWNTGVGVQDIVWRWQYRLHPFGPWTDFATSTHRIYTTLSKPQDPWQQSPFESSNLQLPWAAVLEYACRWAASTQNPTDAATSITRSVYQLGKDGIAKYFKKTQFTEPLTLTFKCAAFLFHLKLGAMKLNCTDCATIVSTFVNILGGELWQSKMVTTFDYNPIIRIGEGTWRQSFFSFHVVAWEEDCDVHNDVFDACLQIDGDEDPTNADPFHVAVLPTDLRFGGLNEKLYRDRLVAPTNPPEVATPTPSERLRRSIHSPSVVERSTLSRNTLDFASHFFDFDFEKWARESSTHKLLSVGELPGVILEGWTVLRSERTMTLRNEGTMTTENGVLSESLWRQTDKLLLINIYEGSSIQSAREWLQHSIAGLHAFDDVEKRQVDLRDLKDVLFFTLDRSGVIFSVSNVVVSLVNAGTGDFSVDSIANNLLERLAVDV